MTSVQHQTRPIRLRGVTLAATIAFASVSVSCMAHRSADDQKLSATNYSPRRMPEGKQWTTANLNVSIAGSYCYEDAEQNCRRYGRLYTWESAQRVCQSLGSGWRLPTDDAWRQLARHYGGVSNDSDDRGKAAYRELSVGGTSGFNAPLGGGRAPDGQYGRLEAHGFYWTASQSSSANAWFSNFGKGGLALHLQNDGEKERAFSVRCVRE
jgi:uncharacterized protein (TIGR02145 family)